MRPASWRRGDQLILEQLKLDGNERETLEHIILQMENERGLDRAAAIADMRFTFIEKVCRETVVKPRESKEHIRSQKMDRILTGKYTAIPCFIGIMALVFWLTFSVIGKLLSDLLEAGIGWLTEAVDAGLAAWHVNEVLHSLVIDGIFNGVGSVLSFLAHHCHAVFLFVSAGGQRLHGPYRFCHGQAASKDRAVRKKHCAHAGGIWLHGARRDGQPDPSL